MSRIGFDKIGKIRGRENLIMGLTQYFRPFGNQRQRSAHANDFILQRNIAGSARIL